MHSGRSVFPKSTVSHLRMQYGYSRMFSLAPVAPAVNAKDRAHVRQSIHQPYSVSGMLWVDATAETHTPNMEVVRVRVHRL